MAMIRLREEVRSALKKKKLYKRESYDSVLCRLMNKKLGSSGIMKGLKVVKDRKLLKARLNLR